MNGLIRPSADIMSSYTGALKATDMRNALAFQPEQQAMEKQRFGWEREGQERIRELDPMVKLTSFTNFVRQQAPNIRWQNYPQAREYFMNMAQELGIPNLTFPEPEQIAQEAMNKGIMPEQYFEQWKNSSLRTAESRIKEMTAQAGLARALKPPKPTTERLYETEEGWQPRGEAVGVKKPTKPVTPKTGKTSEEREIEDLSKLYKYHIGQYNQASRGVGQFIEDPNKERIAKESLERALTIAIQHKRAGGDPSDLGITPEAIKEQYEMERIDKSRAVALLQLLFGME